MEGVVLPTGETASYGGSSLCMCTLTTVEKAVSDSYTSM